MPKFRIRKPTRRTLKECGFKWLFPIQYYSVFGGKDLIGQAHELSGRSGRGCEVCMGEMCEGEFKCLEKN